MPEFDTSHVKNIVLLGHAGSGKTSLAECMLFEAGLINRRGNIADRNTTGDYHELEQERGNSILASSFTQNGGVIRSISSIHRGMTTSLEKSYPPCV